MKPVIWRLRYLAPEKDACRYLFTDGLIFRQISSCNLSTSCIYSWRKGTSGSLPPKVQHQERTVHFCSFYIPAPCLSASLADEHFHSTYTAFNFTFWWWLLIPLATLLGYVFPILLLSRELPCLSFQSECSSQVLPKVFPSARAQRHLWAHVAPGQAANTSLVFPVFQHPSAALWAALLPGTAVSLLSHWCWPKLPCFSLEDVASLKWKYFVSIYLPNTQAGKPWYDSKSRWSIWLQQCFLWWL